MGWHGHNKSQEKNMDFDEDILNSPSFVPFFQKQEFGFLMYVYVYINAFVVFRASRCFKTKSSSHANSPSATGNQTASWMKKYCAFDGLCRKCFSTGKGFSNGQKSLCENLGVMNISFQTCQTQRRISFFHAWHGGVWMLPLSRVWHVSCFLKLSVMSHFALTSSFPDH